MKRKLPWCLVSKGTPRECLVVNKKVNVHARLPHYVSKVPKDATCVCVLWVSPNGLGLAGRMSPQQAIALSALLARVAKEDAEIDDKFIMDRFYVCYKCLSTERQAWRVYDE